MAVLPARVMPVAAEVGGVEGHHHHVADPDADLLVAARAQVRLPGLVGLDPAHLDLGEGIRVHGG